MSDASAFAPHPDLSDGFDAADLVALGALPVDVPSIELVALEGPTPENAPSTAGAAPAPRAASRSGDRHLRLVASLRDQLRERGIEPDAADGWRSLATGALVTVSLKKLAADIWYNLLLEQDLPIGHVTDVLGVLAERDREVRRATLIGRLTGKAATQAGGEALAAWVRMLTGGEKTTDVKVMAHWLWLVKRLATGKRTEHDLMPIVYGTQGGGKSTATERLVAPFEELSTTINAATLTDERRFRQLGMYLIGRWEEMQGAGRAEIESLKHTVTAQQLNYRELSTHSTVVLRRTMSFIGTSNNSVDVMVNDTTGARRFYQLDAMPRCDFALMDRIDHRLIWDAVSEDDAAPIHAVIEVVREAQTGLVHRDAVSMWLDCEAWLRLTIRRVDAEAPMVLEPYDPVRGCEFEDLAARFKHWCNEVGQTGIGVKELAKRLKQEGWRRHRPNPPTGETRRPWLYLRPDRPDAGAPPAPPPGNPVPRGVRMAGEKSPAEDVLGIDVDPGDAYGL